MKKEFKYLPSKKVLLNWFNEEYRNMIAEIIEKHNEKFSSIKEIDINVKNEVIEFMAIELYYNNNSSEYVINDEGHEVYELKPKIAEIIGIDVNEIDTKDPNITTAMMDQKEFLQMINTVNNNFMEHADHLKLLIHDSTFIQLELFGNEEYSPIHFLDNDFNAISSHYMPTDFVNHLTNIYSSKDYKNI